MRKMFRFPMSCLACTSLILAACQQGGGGGKKPQATQTGGQGQPQPSGEQSQTQPSNQSTKPSQQAQGPQAEAPSQQKGVPNGAAPTQQSAESKAPIGTTPTVPPPSTAVPNAPTIARLINPEDDTMILLAKYLMEVHPDAIEATRNQLVDEIFSEDEQAQPKILEIQAAIAKIANNGLYSNDVKGRIAFLQSRLLDRIQRDQYYDVLEKGVFFVAPAAVLGGLAGGGTFPWAYRHAPDVVPAIQSTYRYSRDAIRDKFSNMVQKSSAAVREVRDTVRDRERMNALVDQTKSGIRRGTDAAFEAGRGLKNQIADVARTPFKSAEQLVSENLESLGLEKYDRDAIGELTPVRRVDLQDQFEFQRTNKKNFEYAVLETMYGVPLGIQRVLAFRQQGLVRGSPFETIFVTHPLDAGFAGTIANRLAFQPEAAAAEQKLVFFRNLGTGAVSVVKWPVTKFTNMLKSAGVKIQPLFQSIDVPTAVGTGALSAAGFGASYFWGFGNGEQSAQQYEAVDLENMIHHGNQTPVALSSLQSSHP